MHTIITDENSMNESVYPHGKFFRTYSKWFWSMNCVSGYATVPQFLTELISSHNSNSFHNRINIRAININYNRNKDYLILRAENGRPCGPEVRGCRRKTIYAVLILGPFRTPVLSRDKDGKWRFECTWRRANSFETGLLDWWTVSLLFPTIYEWIGKMAGSVYLLHALRVDKNKTAGYISVYIIVSVSMYKFRSRFGLIYDVGALENNLKLFFRHLFYRYFVFRKSACKSDLFRKFVFIMLRFVQAADVAQRNQERVALSK